jgi:putative ABC transport system substrate-binding protein
MNLFKLGLAAAAVLWSFSAAMLLGYTISINQYIELPSLNESLRGFKEQLAEQGLEITFLEHNALGSMASAARIANQIKDENPDLVLAVATPSAQATAQAIKDIPVLFMAVTDPVQAGLAASLERPGANVTGTSDLNAAESLVDLIREIQPEAKTLGFIYNPEEANSASQLELVRKAAAKNNLILAEAAASASAEVLPAFQSLAGRVDAIYLPTDSLVISSYETILHAAVEQHIPLYPSDESSVHKGGVATLSINYYLLGRQTGRMAAKILQEQASPAEIPVEFIRQFSLVINTGFATDIFLSVSPSVVKRAQVLIK